MHLAADAATRVKHRGAGHSICKRLAGAVAALHASPSSPVPVLCLEKKREKIKRERERERERERARNT